MAQCRAWAVLAPGLTKHVGTCGTTHPNAHATKGAQLAGQHLRLLSASTAWSDPWRRAGHWAHPAWALLRSPLRVARLPLRLLGWALAAATCARFVAAALEADIRELQRQGKLPGGSDADTTSSAGAGASASPPTGGCTADGGAGGPDQDCATPMEIDDDDRYVTRTSDRSSSGGGSSGLASWQQQQQLQRALPFGAPTGIAGFCAARRLQLQQQALRPSPVARAALAVRERQRQ
jgi:hypothetical protein